MRIPTLRKRAVTTATLGIAGVAAASVMAAPPAQAAAVYWQFKSAYGTCLTAGRTEVAFASSCNGSSYQQWDWVHDSNGETYAQLKNRATGRCLATDNKNNANAVWTSDCVWRDGQRFHYNQPSGFFTNIWSKKLRAESDGAVRAGLELAYWDGWHN
ncbi:hypothetical protein GCM10010191_47570 [Actinomadura vinacea]|uniref:Ricin B lectin domain-containing protein n=1 Tax=Actinomadura vinacea TaxID=115336 RepID=A0ABN3JG42_9ACTN